jgi:ElaB/YqjD/DUF883 family membrane-anchored ribosome-binding protein
MYEKTEGKTDQMVNEKVASAEHLKLQTAEAIEEAARKLRSADVSTKGEDIKGILHDIEARVNQFKADVGVEYEKREAEYNEMAEPFETVITDHPIPSVLIAAGVGFLLGALLFKSRD